MRRRHLKAKAPNSRVMDSVAVPTGRAFMLTLFVFLPGSTAMSFPMYSGKHRF